MSELMDALTALEQGDDITITVAREGEELELDVYVLDIRREESERRGYAYLKGSLSVDLELTNSAVERLQDFEGDWLRNATHRVDIRAKEPRPGEWENLTVDMWDPVAEGGELVSHEWTDLGELRSVKTRD